MCLLNSITVVGPSAVGSSARTRERRTHDPDADPLRLRCILDRFANLAVDTANHPSFVIGYDTVLSNRRIVT